MEVSGRSYCRQPVVTDPAWAPCEDSQDSSVTLAHEPTVISSFVKGPPASTWRKGYREAGPLKA